MKTLALLLLLAAPMLAHATDIHPGESLDDVRAALGTPNGQEQVSNRLTLFYDRGQVQLVDGRVVSSDFASPEELAAQQKADDAKAAQLRAQRMAEGKALKAQKLADPNFTSALPGIQLAFWQDFRARYPEVSCDAEYKLALDHWKEGQQQIVELGAPVNAANQPYNNGPYYTSPYYCRYPNYYHYREHEHEDYDRDEHHDFRYDYHYAPAYSPSGDSSHHDSSDHDNSTPSTNTPTTAGFAPSH
jgi:hypothetical protein